MEKEIKEVFKDFPANMTTLVTELLPGSVIVRFGGNLVRNVRPSSRFRVGGKAKTRLNKTEVEEIISEHFVTEVEKL